MAATTYVLVRCADYNGHKDILFMMDATDFRLTDKRFSAGYPVIADGDYDKKAARFTIPSTGDAYQVHGDWSLTLHVEGERDYEVTIDTIYTDVVKVRASSLEQAEKLALVIDAASEGEGGTVMSRAEVVEVKLVEDAA